MEAGANLMEKCFFLMKLRYFLRFARKTRKSERQNCGGVRAALILAEVGIVRLGMESG